MESLEEKLKTLKFQDVKIGDNSLQFYGDKLKCKNCKSTEKQFRLVENTFSKMVLECSSCSCKEITEECPHCSTTNYFKTNNAKKCIECNKNYKIYICASNKCRKIIISKKYIEGYAVTCEDTECKTEFALVSCIKCLRQIVFIKTNTKSQNEMDVQECHYMTNYLDGQVIQCPYEDCNTIFTQSSCFSCYESKKLEGPKMSLIGETVNCDNLTCLKKFCKMFCIYCCRLLWYADGIYFEGRKVICPYTDCAKKAYVVKCPKCLRFNCWDENSYYTGQPAECAYKDCKYNFSKAYCSHCAIRKEYMETGFKFGVNNKCSCKKEFTYNVCKCKSIMVIKNHYSECQGIKCVNKECARDIHNCYCLHCNNLLILDRISYRFGMTIVCPYEHCGKQFNYLYCKKCGKGLYYPNNDYQEGDLVKCIDCAGEQFHFLICEVCGRGIQFNTRSDISKALLTCVYPDCKSVFYLGKLHETKYYASPHEFTVKGKYLAYLRPKKYDFEIKRNNNI